MQQRDVVNAREAATILSERAGRPIHPDYVRQLRKYKKLKAINEPATEEEKGKTRAYLFWRTDVEQISIGPKRVKGVRSPRKHKPVSK